MKLKLQARLTILISAIVIALGFAIWLIYLIHIHVFSSRIQELLALSANVSTDPEISLAMAEQTAFAAKRNLAMFSVSLVLVITALLGLIARLSRHLTRPMRDLVRYARDITQGDYARKIKIYTENEWGRLANYLDSMGDALQRGTDKVRYLAYHDGLTGLPNREMLREYLDFIIGHAARHGQNVVVMFIDLDDFKNVNDTLGHDAGDWLLKEVSERIKNCMRQEDYVGQRETDIEAVVSRHGGDEFTVILPHVKEPMNAAIVARRIIDSVSAPFVLKGQEVVVGASIGIASYPNNGTNVEVLLKNADIAMYQAKSDGKNVYKFYSDTMNVRALHKLSLETDLRKALDKQEMELWYQPIIDLKTEEVVGSEALVRWDHPKRGILMPNEFIPIVERIGLITDIGEWVARRACRQAYKWQQLSGDRPKLSNVSINISSVQFRRQDVPTIIKNALNMSGLPPEYLHVEITETGLIFGDQKALSALQAIRDLGVEVWVDDFGTGYSSLNYLRQFPVNGVKVDRSFVKDIADDASDYALVSAIISMSHSLGLQVIAEGVETQAQLDILREMKCDMAQGYLIGRPVSPEKFEDSQGIMMPDNKNMPAKQ